MAMQRTRSSFKDLLVSNAIVRNSSRETNWSWNIFRPRSINMENPERVEFKTLDGLVLRGFLYPADTKGPGVVMTPGVSPFHDGETGE